MTRLWKRECEVSIAKPTGFFASGLGFAGFQGNFLTLKGLRVQFHIEKNASKEPNTCDVVVSNLSDDHRAALRQKPLQVRVDAGYDGKTERLFVGDLVFGHSVMNEPDWETTIQLADGSRAFRNANIIRSFKAGISIRQCLLDVAGAMGLKLPSLDSAEFDKKLTVGISLHGPAQRELSKLLRPLRFDWSIQDGSLQVLARNAPNADQAVVVSETTGMLGSPELGPPESKGKPPILTVVSMLKPRVRPNGLIKVEARTHSGLYRLKRVTHEGDTHGEQFQTTMEAVAA